MPTPHSASETTSENPQTTEFPAARQGVRGVQEALSRPTRTLEEHASDLSKLGTLIPSLMGRQHRNPTFAHKEKTFGANPEKVRGDSWTR